jgi:3-oxoacyl-[acyl-carrier-protein] synthase II
MVELLGSLLALKHGVIPRTLNFETPDPNCPVLVQGSENRPLHKPYFLKLSFTDMGQCGAVIFRRWE